MTELENLLDEYKDSKNIRKRLNQQKCNKKKFSSLELIFITLIICIFIYACQIIYDKGLFRKKQINLGYLLNFSK
tara:strand:+ start:771 stop:995 length:225 start_codon:yes stop_codon:yes gene_type:complete